MIVSGVLFQPYASMPPAIVEVLRATHATACSHLRFESPPLSPIPRARLLGVVHKKVKIHLLQGTVP